MARFLTKTTQKLSRAQIGLGNGAVQAPITTQPACPRPPTTHNCQITFHTCISSKHPRLPQPRFQTNSSIIENTSTPEQQRLSACQMARGKSKQQQAATAANADQDAPLPKGAVVDAQSERVFVPMDTVSSDIELPQSTDSVADALAGNYSEGIVDEVCVGCAVLMVAPACHMMLLPVQQNSVSKPQRLLP